MQAGKYTSAAQAYELLRIRRRMQEEFFAQADKALDENDIPRAVHGYQVATGLAYDYAAFPEPLPAVPNYQEQALIKLHGEYPDHPDKCIALQPPETHARIALSYLLMDAEAAARLENRPLEQLLTFIETLIRRTDPEWDAFAARYKAACALTAQLAQRLQREANRAEGVPDNLAGEVLESESGFEPRSVPDTLLGRSIPRGEWWQYMKELAYEHPAAVLFVSRQAVSKDVEIIIPRLRQDSPLPQKLGLT